MTSALANLLNVHMFTSQNDGFYDVSVNSGSGRYKLWEEFTHTFYSEHARVRGGVRGCRHCFEAPPDSVHVITTLPQIMTVFRELRIREDRLA
jgi:predicted aldo/keto reductase-like oxidoreductase